MENGFHYLIEHYPYLAGVRPLLYHFSSTVVASTIYLFYQLGVVITYSFFSIKFFSQLYLVTNKRSYEGSVYRSQSLSVGHVLWNRHF